ncbi:hypothetical protein XA68_18537 [Ophiocordyceps unilateralis]|uniref:Zn(2)-C6 fungal-type domain-containing protein n=1 Tax=Ophiocordyceps unilateralis TaxID=268505 RepID=A0A2A9P2F1_OPHUN|nr:hypothetical protein XA68_18537 [Ophiocordyceps unilateralis]
MADDQHQHQQQSRFPPVSPENHHHQSRAPVAPRAPMAATVLPSIHETRAAAGYASQPPPPSARPYPLDGRYSSPNAVNGYPPPPASQQSSSSTFLPPLQASPTDARSPAYPPPDQRTPYLDDRRPPGPYGAEGFYFRGPPPGPVPPNSYPRPPQGAYQEYAQQAAGAPSLAQAAPRQRTSIACRYCRKRKIRCSGYQNTPGGKCQNCARMNQECIFQPVSSSSSTAFIPVSAVPGGVPPGTQLFGAYGQPLAPNVMAGAHPYPPQQHPGGPSPGMYPPPPQQQQQQQQQQQPPPPPTQSPTGSYSSYGDEASQVVGRRRRRTPEEREEGYRLPPPRGGEDEPRRRSPAELSGDSSPGGVPHAPSYQSSRQSPRTAPSAQMANAPNGSSGGSTPARQQSGQPSSVMSLSNLVEKNDIDRTMIDRLNHARDAKSANGSR